MDPTNYLPAEVNEKIFGHLSGRELLSAALVSSVWNLQIGSSIHCMKKLKLGMRSDWMEFSEDEKNILLCGRRYQNVLISEATGLVSFVYEVMQMSRQWKSVEIFCLEFPTTSDCVKFFKLFEASVENLVLQQVTIKEPEDVVVDFNFAKLKTLRMKQSDKIFMSMFNRCSSLETLNLAYVPSDRSEVMEMLSCHQNLKNLIVSSELYNIIFSADVKQLPTHLEELTVNSNGLFVDVSATWNHFFSYLETQTSSLKKLNFDNWLGVEVMKLAFRMEALKEFRMFHLPALDWSAMSLPASKSIETLDIVTVDIHNKLRIEAILKAVPTVKHLRLRSMNLETAEFIAVNLKLLQSIELVHSSSDDFKLLMPNVVWK